MVPVFPLVPDCWKKEESCLRYHSEAAFFFLEECVGDTMHDVKTVAVHVLCLAWWDRWCVCLSELQVDERLHCAGFDLYDQIDGEDKEYYLSPER